ncbi:hypothetical protein HGRIS_012198 [Hohenbuehelia grisea]|uniref:Uncharacterized protein n=1 Tax=Hohenbuehelia grisea TaxID=104357 RepID=A0ABR3IRL1_9AGAR
MAYSPSHRTSQSVGMANQGLQLPHQQRRMTMPNSGARPPSPLRNGFVPDTSTGIDLGSHSDDDSDDDDFDDDDFRGRSSPSPSVTQLATTFANKVGNLVSNIAPARSPGPATSPRPSIAEIEADAERARDQSRREAERIMTAESDERRRVEERVLALLHSGPADKANNGPLPPPPARSQTLPPSPSNSQKESTSWWSAAKNRLTPTKEPLTPAQQVIQDTKAREKEEKKRAKELASIEKDMGKGKGRDRSEWPADPVAKFTNSALASMQPSSAALHVPRKPVPTIPQSPSPSPGRSTDRDALMPPRRSATSPNPNPSTPPKQSSNPYTASPISLSNSNLASPGMLASPSSNTNGRSAASPSNQGSTSSPNRATTPLPIYATFNSTGTLDVPVTLLTIARRFEKLERWTVGHVRALEDRMGDVEAWLVEREESRVNQKGEGESKDAKTTDASTTNGGADVELVKQSMHDMQTDLGELQSRVSMLGREMARMASSAGRASPSPSVDSFNNAQPPHFHPRTPSPTPLLNHEPQETFSRSSGPRDKKWGDLSLSAGPSSSVRVREAPRRASERGVVSESEDENASVQGSDAENAQAYNSGATAEPIGLGIAPFTTSPPFTPHKRAPSLTAHESTSPPLARVSSRGHGANQHGKAGSASGTRLPYPTGDYAPASFISPASTGNSFVGSLGAIATMTPSSPPSLSTVSAAMAATSPVSPQTPSSGIGKWSGRPLPASPGQASAQGSMQVPSKVLSPRLRTSPRPQGLSNAASPTPSPGASPTPRKRYTVALGGPLTRPDSDTEGGSVATESDDNGEDDGAQEETIGKRASERLRAAVGQSSDSANTKKESAKPAPKPRAQSVYGFSSVYETGPPKPVAPLNPGRLRARSTDRFSISSNGSSSAPADRGKFIDPYVAKRERERESRKIAMPRPVGKVPIGDLVAFFDGEKGSG